MCVIECMEGDNARIHTSGYKSPYINAASSASTPRGRVFVTVELIKFGLKLMSTIGRIINNWGEKSNYEELNLITCFRRATTTGGARKRWS